MSDLHTVVLSVAYIEQHRIWLRPFLFDMKELGMHFFHCYSYQEAAGGLMEFEVHQPTNAEKLRILLPPHAIVAILLYQTQKIPPGFVHPKEIREQ